MKKILLFCLAVAMFLIVFAGCNKQLADFTYKFDRAIIELPNGEVIDGPVDSWTDYEDGDQIQVKVHGITYLVHSSDVALIANP